MTSDEPTEAARAARAERVEQLEATMRDAPTLTASEYRSRSRRSFLFGGVAAAAGYIGFRSLQNRPLDARTPDILRRGYELNESVWSRLSFGRKAPEFSVSESKMPRSNGRIGIREEIDLAEWTMRVEAPDGSLLEILRMDEIRAMPRIEMVTELKCIEGWSEIVYWGGTQFSGFAARYADDIGTNFDYVSAETPDGDYYIGLDAEAAMHPQTLLSYEMQGEALTQTHGAPLRLVTPLKYGIKHLKRIGTIRFTNERPADYWAERGYDWYSGH